MPDRPDKLVYPEFRYIKGQVPYCIYIPRKEIMLKLMRACIGVTREEDLWFNLGQEKLLKHKMTRQSTIK